MPLVSKKIILLFLILYAASLPAQYFYIPDNDTNVVQVEDQGDLNLSLSYPLKRRVNIQAAFSPLKYLSFSAAYYRHRLNEVNDLSHSFNTSGESFTGSIGVYRFIHKKEEHNFFLTKHMKGILVYAKIGYSKGNISNKQDQLNQVDLNYQNIFFRSGFSLDYGKFGINFSTRFLALDFQQGDITGNPNDLAWLLSRFNRDVEERDPRNLKETMIRINFKAKRFELYVDYNTIRDKKDRTFRQVLFIKETYNLGILIKIHEFFKH